MYSLDVLLSQFGTSLLFHVWLQLLLLDLHRFLRRQVRWPGIPISLRIFQFVVIHTVKSFGVVYELLIAKFRLKLKKVGKTTRQFRYVLNQIPYDYTVQVTNRLKGLDLIDRVPGELWTEVCDIVQETGIKTIPKKKKCKKSIWLSEEALQIAVKRRELKNKGEKERYTHLNPEFQRIARRDEKAFINDQCKEIEENNRMGKTRDLFKKIRDTKGTFHAKMSSIKDRNGMDLTETRRY